MPVAANALSNVQHEFVFTCESLSGRHCESRIRMDSLVLTPSELRTSFSVYPPCTSVKQICGFGGFCVVVESTTSACSRASGARLPPRTPVFSFSLPLQTSHPEGPVGVSVKRSQSLSYGTQK